MKYLEIKCFEDDDVTRDIELSAVIKLESIEAIKESMEFNPKLGHNMNTYRVYFYGEPSGRFRSLRITRNSFIELKKTLKGIR